MKVIKSSLIIFLTLSLISCVTNTPNLSVNKNFWQNKQEVIGVAMLEVPQPTAHKAGSQGLLDLAINNANASDLEVHLNSLNTKELVQITDKIDKYLEANGYKTKKFEKPINISELPDFETQGSDGEYFSSSDFRSYKTNHGIDKLVLIKVIKVGTIRSYYGFIPTSEPSGISHLHGQVINLTNNKLEWNQTVVQQTPHTASEWDVPPNFPGLTKSVHAAIDQSKQELFNSFAQ